MGDWGGNWRRTNQTASLITPIEDNLNNRPRKKNNYLTPNQIYENISQVVQ